MQSMEIQASIRTIRSYVLRQGRMTVSQAQALKTLWPTYGVDFVEGGISLSSLFKRQAALIVEIGFGMGDSLLQMALDRPYQNFLGIEVHAAGVGALLAGAAKAHLENLRVIRADAVPVIQSSIPDHSVDCFQIFFPDPWHKKRHYKRRLIQVDFVHLLVSKLKPQGRIHLATDWAPYAEHMMSVLSGVDELVNVEGPNQYCKGQHLRPETKFERRGQRLGHQVFDLLFELAPTPEADD